MVTTNANTFQCLMPACRRHSSSRPSHQAPCCCRAEQDAFAASSHKKAAAAARAGKFKDEIVPVHTKVTDPKTKETRPIVVDADDGVRGATTADALSKLKPAFKAGGSTTAGNSSQVCHVRFLLPPHCCKAMGPLTRHAPLRPGTCLPPDCCVPPASAASASPRQPSAVMVHTCEGSIAARVRCVQPSANHQLGRSRPS